ncbi:MAG TPA: CdaR family protein, partial [Bacillus sp. (in: firmicutes)]|nr:CdaR family protein [Bacillus sp. (in: firmicutes)]
ETITDVPVNVYYDSENTIVKGIPDSVNVTLEGPKSILQPTKLQKDFEVYVDLTNMQLGSRKVKVKYRNISEKLDVKIEPQTLMVEIEEKVSKNFPIEVDVDINGIRDGYIAKKPIVNPSSVKIVGAKNVIEEIAYVKAVVEVDEASETVEKRIKVIALDKRLNRLNVDIQPRWVTVKVPIATPSKKVPLKVKTTGSLSEGLNIQSIAPSPGEVTVFGPEDILDGLSVINNIELDVSKLTKSESIWVNVPIPKGAKRVYPEKVEVQVELEKDDGEEETGAQETDKKVFENLPLSLTGKSSSFTYQLLTPETGALDIEIMGPSAILAEIQPKDIQLSIDVGELLSGDHEVPIAVKVPQNLTYKLALSKSKVRVTENQDDTQEESDLESQPEAIPDNPVDKNEQGYEDQNISNIQPQG